MGAIGPFGTGAGIGTGAVADGVGAIGVGAVGVGPLGGMLNDKLPSLCNKRAKMSISDRSAALSLLL